MTTTTQQPPSNPTLDFANAIFEETNGALELIEILHDIAEGNDEEATANDRIAATKVLMDRGLGKCPKHISPNPESAESDNHTNHSSDTPQAAPHSGSESPRLVTQIDDALNQSIGPAPSAHTDVGAIRESPVSTDPFDPFSIHFTIQQHIFEITNNGQTLRETLKEIARAKDDPRITPFHRIRATRLLLDRLLGANPNALQSATCPDCRQGWKNHSCPPAHPERSAAESKDDEEAFDEEVWEEIIAELNQKVKDGILHPDPNAPKIDISSYLPPEDYVMPPEVAAEGAAKFWAANALRLERRKQWPEIEERRRKKLAQIYPSHSEDEDGEPPDT